METGCAVLGSAAPWCSEHLAGRCFLLWFGFPEAKSQFLPAVCGSRWGSGPAGGGGCSKSLSRADPGMGWGSRGAQAQVGEGQGDWLLLLFVPAAPALNHQAQKP